MAKEPSPKLYGARLVNNTYAAPGVQGCGIYNGADAALDAGLELPSPSGHNTSVLTGAFQIANSEIVEEGYVGGGPLLRLVMVE